MNESQTLVSPRLSDELVALAHACGVATEYVDWQDRPVQVPAETLVAVLAAMELDASTPESATSALAALEERRWTQALPPCEVVEQGTARQVWVHLPHGQPVEVRLLLETGTVRALEQLDVWVEPREVDGALVGEATFALPADLPLGYHTLHARTGVVEHTSTVVVTPSWLGLPASMGDRRGWGFATQLYSVRSAQSWGLGDLADLTDLGVWSGADLGADYVLVNPLHAAEPVAPMEPSPYLPTSRRFFNPIYLRVERIPEFADLGRSDRSRVEKLRKALSRQVDRGDTIDRDAAWGAKRAALELLYAVPRSAGREADLRAFRERGGPDLRDFALWNVLAERHGADYRSWPEALRRPDSAAVAELADAHADEIGFHAWLQWVLDEQLQTAQAKAVGAGMSLGVMHDLAVGIHPGGADAWQGQDAYARDVRVGAPPDAYNQIGQDWSQPPWRPDRLEELAYAPFRELVGNLLRHAGGVRVDHIIGLFRLWWIPSGAAPGAGTYVRYDHEAMIGVLALEAHRAGALVVGEDLGVVESSAREYLARRGVLGTSILWFERDAEGRPLPAEQWRELCMASVTTHDLPPTAGYLAGDHVALRERLGLLTRPLEEETAADAADREAWLAELRERGLLDGSPAAESGDSRDAVEALHRYLTLSPARLRCVALVDAVGDRRTQNQPGTSEEYPNWRVPLSGPDGSPLALEEVLVSERATALAHTVRRSATGQ